MTRVLKLVAKGFKSFGKYTELQFGEKFNVIIGPNGSGKSNVLDAFCFVLGKAGAKGMRAEKSSNLIYNGGKSKQAAKEGMVAIYFDNSQKTFNTEGDQVKVSRTIRENGNSTYRINDEIRTRQQVLELLSQAQINPDGYNIILQGDITRLVEMSTQDRRKVIEEIAGIGIYESRKQKALGELEKVDRKLEEASIILTERGQYLKELKKDRDQAMKYKELQDQIDTNKATHIHYKIEEATERMHKHDTNLLESDKKLKKYLEEISALKLKIAEDQKAVAALNQEIEERGEKEQVEVHKQVEQLKVAMNTNAQRIEFCKSEITKTNVRTEQLKETLAELEKKIAELTAQKKDHERQTESKKKTLEQLQEKIKRFREKNKMDDIGDLDKEIDKLEKDSEKIETELTALRQQMQDKIREKDKLDYQVQTIDERIAKIAEIEKENKSELEQLKQKKFEFKKAASDLNRLLTEDQGLAAKMTQVRKRLQESREELAKVSAKNLSQKEFSQSENAVAKILEQKDKIGGIYGTLADIGSVNAQYSLALEIAAGPKLKSIVVENDKVAADCIKYLRDQKVGVATFLPLNKIRPSSDADAKSVLKEQGVLGMATDFVTFDKKFAPVFSHALGNTLVIENIEVGRRIGIGRYRMVTLDGDLAESSGMMRGGFVQRRGGGIGFKEKELGESLSRLEHEVGDLEGQEHVIDGKRKEIEEQIDRLRVFKAELEGDIIKMEKSLHLESDDIDMSKKQKQQIRDDMKTLDKDQDKLTDKISDMNRELAGIKRRKQEMREKITDLRNPMLLAELNTFQQQQTEIENTFRDFEAANKGIDMQISSVLEPERLKTQSILKENEKETKKFTDEIAVLEKKIKDDKKDLTEKEKKEKEFYKQFKELFDKRELFNTTIQKNEGTIIMREEQSREIERKIGSFSEEISGLKAELAALDEAFKVYKEKNIKLALEKNEQQLIREINSVERMALDLGFVNMRALEIYDAVEKEYHELMEKKERLTKEKDDVVSLMNEIELRKKELFMKMFEVVNANFQKIFQSLSTKGEAYLDLEEAEKLEDVGCSIKVRLSSNRFMDIRSLSGGEKTLTALAFLFAIQEHDPAYFYILDEVDAALDKRNAEKLAKLVRAYCARAQYIVISHNDAVITEGDTLYGVSMDEHGVTQVTSLKV